MAPFLSSSPDGSASKSSRASRQSKDFDAFAKPSFWQTPIGLLVTVVVVAAVVGVGTYFVCPLIGGCKLFGPKVEATYETALGETKSVVLADQTVITLGPLTTLEVYEGEREVKLTGAGVFKVTPDLSRTFIVRANNTVTKVLGIDSASTPTEFGIRGYEKDSATSIGVLEGRIRLGEVVILNTGNLADVTKKGGTSVTFDRNMGPFNAWMGGNLEFAETPLSVVGAELARWFDIEVSIPDTSMRNDTVTAIFPIDSLATAFQAISVGGGVSVRRVGKVVTFGKARKAEPYEAQ